MTIARPSLGPPPGIRRGWLLAGVVLTGLAAPLAFVLGSMTLAVSLAGALALTYAFLPSGYPLFGTIAGFAFAFGVPALVLWILLA